MLITHAQKIDGQSCESWRSRNGYNVFKLAVSVRRIQSSFQGGDIVHGEIACTVHMMCIHAQYACITLIFSKANFTLTALMLMFHGI